jgi:hypothetical protein
MKNLQLNYDSLASFRPATFLNVKSDYYYMPVTVATKMQHFNELNNFLFFLYFAVSVTQLFFVEIMFCNLLKIRN